MYDLPYHKEPDKQAVKNFIVAHPFALLTGSDLKGRPVATQVPAFLEDQPDGGLVLTGHIMKNTDHHEALQENNQALMVFSGPQVYVSGSWYREPHTPSTWNYMSVHVRGTIRFLDGAALEAVLRKTSLHFENNNGDSPTVYDKLPGRLTEKLVRLIVAFEIAVSDIDTVFKLSQDRDPESYCSIIEKLKSQGEQGRAISDEMQARFKQVFTPDDLD